MSVVVKNPRAKEIAEQILVWLGGTCASVMIGMRNQAYGTDDKGNAYLSFRFKGSRKANYCKITLNALDLYDVEIGKVWSRKYKVVAPHEDVYNDMLKGVFEQSTELYLSL